MSYLKIIVLLLLNTSKAYLIKEISKLIDKITFHFILEIYFVILIIYFHYHYIIIKEVSLNLKILNNC